MTEHHDGRGMGTVGFNNGVLSDPFSVGVVLARAFSWPRGRIDWRWLFPSAAELDRRRRVAPLPPTLGSWR
jgi:hypothetical protein